MKKSISEICIEKGCNEFRGTNKIRCPRHHAIFQKENNPIGYHYSVACQNAKRLGRKVSFTLLECRNAICNHDLKSIININNPEEVTFFNNITKTTIL